MNQSVHQARHYRYYELVMAAFVVVLICSNLIGPAKIAQIHLPLLGVSPSALACCSSPYRMCSATSLLKSMATRAHAK